MSSFQLRQLLAKISTRPPKPPTPWRVLATKMLESLSISMGNSSSFSRIRWHLSTSALDASVPRWFTTSFEKSHCQITVPISIIICPRLCFFNTNHAMRFEFLVMMSFTPTKTFSPGLNLLQNHPPTTKKMPTGVQNSCSRIDGIWYPKKKSSNFRSMNTCFFVFRESECGVFPQFKMSIWQNNVVKAIYWQRTERPESLDCW